MKKYWIVSQLFYPDETSTGYVMTRIAESILKIGEVNVICGPANYHTAKLSATNELDQRIKVSRVNVPSWNKNNLILRLISFILLTFGVAWKVFLNVKKSDTLIMVTNPPTLILLLGLLKRIKGFKMYVILQDVFPENLAVTGFIRKESFAYRMLLKFFNSAYNQADELIACGEDMKQVFETKITKNIPISVITNWADHLEVFEEKGLDKNKYYGLDLSGKVVLQFAGNIGRVQGLDQFLKLYQKVNNENLFLVIIGDGAFKSRLLKMQEENQIKNILFLPSKPRTEQQHFLNATDIGLVTLSSGMFGLGVPSKVYNVFSAAKPVLFIGDYNCEIYQYIKNYGVGWAFSWDDEVELIQFLMHINCNQKSEFETKGSLARKLVEQRFTREYILSQYKDVLIA
jgi:glycosyltransferase involved in cell wall biosynthesis